MEPTPVEHARAPGEGPAAEGSALALVGIDESERVTLAEGACGPILGADAADLLGAELAASGLPAAAQRGLQQALAGAASTGTLRRGGLEAEARFLPRARGGALLVARGLGGHTRAEWRASHGYLRAVLRQVPGAVWVTDRQLRITHALGSVFSLGGNDPRQFIGRTIAAYVGSDDPADPVVARHRAALDGMPQSFQNRFQGRLFQTLLEPLRDGRGRVVGLVGAAVDITEQMATQEQLAAAKRRLEEAQRVAHVGSFEWDVGSNRLTWSEEMHRIYGTEPGRFSGTFEAFLEHVHPDDRRATEAAIFDALRNHRPLAYDHRVLTATGAVRVLQTRGEVVTDGEGKPVRIVGSCWDVTELKETAQKLERTVSLHRATLDATADGILVVNRQGRVVAHNRRFLALWGIPPALMRQGADQALRDHVVDQLEDPESFELGVEELYRHPERESFDALHFRDGRVFERYSTPQRVGAEIVGRVWSFRDVTERERLLGRATFLADAARLLASLDVESALDGVAHLAVPYLGDACAVDLFGDVGPRRLLVVTRDPDRVVAPTLHRAAASGHATIYASDGLSHLAAPLLIKDAVAGVLTFVAPRNRRYGPPDLEVAEELARRAALSLENARLYRGAQEALRARDEFLTLAAHEIRGPVTSLHLAAQSLRSAHPDLAATRRLLDIVERDDRRLARFVDDLLEVGRIRAGQLHFIYEEVDLAEVVREAAARLRDELTRSGSSFTVTSEAPVVGQWDSYRMTQVATNLLSNAIKFGLGKPIEVRLGARNGWARLEVRDHGTGISAEEQQSLFKPFERRVSVRHYGGLGLGLFIVQTTVEGLGGRVGVRSAPGEGSTFTVELPLERSR